MRLLGLFVLLVALSPLAYGLSESIFVQHAPRLVKPNLTNSMQGPPIEEALCRIPDVSGMAVQARTPKPEKKQCAGETFSPFAKINNGFLEMSCENGGTPQFRMKHRVVTADGEDVPAIWRTYTRPVKVDGTFVCATCNEYPDELPLENKDDKETRHLYEGYEQCFAIYSPLRKAKASRNADEPGEVDPSLPMSKRMAMKRGQEFTFIHIMLGSLSRAQFYRRFTETIGVSSKLDRHKVFDLELYHSLSKRAAANQAAMFTGLPSTFRAPTSATKGPDGALSLESPELGLEGPEGVAMHQSYLWEIARDLNFTTAFANNRCPDNSHGKLRLLDRLTAGMGMFSEDSPSFDDALQDLFCTDRIMNDNGWRNTGEPSCVGARRSASFVFEYAERALHNTLSARKYINIKLSDTHESTMKVGARSIDPYLAVFLESIRSMPNVLLFISSDHGYQHGPHARTQEGKLEMKTPLGLLIVPHSYLQNNLPPGAAIRLRHNSKRLITHFDMYETILDLLLFGVHPYYNNKVGRKLDPSATTSELDKTTGHDAQEQEEEIIENDATDTDISASAIERAAHPANRKELEWLLKLRQQVKRDRHGAGYTGSSLISEVIPIDRTCGDIGIGKGFCACVKVVDAD